MHTSVILKCKEIFWIEKYKTFLPDNVMIRSRRVSCCDVRETEKDKQSDPTAGVGHLSVAPVHTAGLLMDNWPSQSVNDRDKSSFLILPLLLPTIVFFSPSKIFPCSMYIHRCRNIFVLICTLYLRKNI